MARYRAELRQARAVIAEQDRDLNDYKTAAKADAARMKEELAVHVGQLQARHADDLGLVGLGVQDDLGRDTIRRAWEAQPKAARGESPARWWASTVDAHKTAAEKGGEGAPVLPPALSAYLPKIEAKAPPQQAGQGKPPQRQPWAGSAPDQGVASRQAPLQGVQAVLAGKVKNGDDFVSQLAAAERGR